MTHQSEDFCPVPESLLGRLYRSNPDGVTALLKTVPTGTRAMLAYYCYRRAHLEGIGIAIASTCSKEDLYDVAGRAGWDLHARGQTPQPPEPARSKSRHGISLASGPLWDIPKFDD
jgi:hypothetical protein